MVEWLGQSVTVYVGEYLTLWSRWSNPTDASVDGHIHTSNIHGS